MVTSSTPSPPPNKLQQAIQEVSGANGLDADIVLYSGSIYEPACWHLDNLLSGLNQKRRNVLLFLTTSGGSADEAFRLARCVQNHYSGGHFNLLVGPWCKSAGTLLAMGANQLIMSDRSELGPIDVQVSKKDEVGERTSGLTPVQALMTLQVQVDETFTAHFDDLTERLGGYLSTRTVTQIATRLTVGCFNKIYEHIDPMRIAEFQRFVNIAKHYGSRLSEGRDNLAPESVEMLIYGYPSHEFVIDRTEARRLFSKVRAPTDAEQVILDSMLSKVMRALADHERPIPLIEALSTDLGAIGNRRNTGGGYDRRSPKVAGAKAPSGSDGKGSSAAGDAKPATRSPQSPKDVAGITQRERARRSANGRATR